MRFYEDGPSLPHSLLEKTDSGRTLLFCGAGVSIAAARLPSFHGLAKRVADNLLLTADDPLHLMLDQISSEASDIPFELRAEPSAERMFTYWGRRFARADVEEAVARALRSPPAASQIHQDLLTLSGDPDGNVRIVTTNFDTLFEDVSPNATVWPGPKLPDLARGEKLGGIVKLHGSVDPEHTGAVPPGFVLSTASFGEAYLTGGWAREFMLDAVRHHTIIFVGYAADDPPMRYLLEALADRSETGDLYAFQANGPDAADRWRAKGVVPLIYQADDGHDGLWRTVSAWAKRRRDPSAWRTGVVAMAAQRPEELAAFQRGQVAEVVSSFAGARLFAEATPVPPAYWLRVFDASERYATPEWADNDHWRNGEIVYDPYSNLHLDDDPAPLAVDRSNRQAERDPSKDAWDGFASLGQDAGGSFRNGANDTELDPRLFQLGRWLTRCADQPAALWWALRQSSLHPTIQRLLEDLPSPLDRLPSEAPVTWQRLVDAQVPSRIHDHWHNEYAFERFIKRIGWGREALRRLERDSRTRLILRPKWKRGTPPEPGSSLRRMVETEIDVAAGFFRLEVPDAYLPAVCAILRRNLEWASLHDPRPSSWHHHYMPQFHPVEDANSMRSAHDLEAAVSAFTTQLTHLHTADPAALRAEVARWPMSGAPFAKMRIWLTLQDFVSADWSGDLFMQIDDEAFWNSYQQRDLLFAWLKRWNDLSATVRATILHRVSAGAGGEEERWKRVGVLQRLAWLRSEGCSFPADVSKRLDEMIAATPEWRTDYARGAVDYMGIQGGWVQTDDDTTILNDVPIEDIVRVARENTGRTDRITVQKNPFEGLVRNEPDRALQALWIAEASTEDQVAVWSDLLHHDSIKAWPAARRQTVLEDAFGLSDSVFDGLLLPLSWFLRKTLEVDRSIFWTQETLVDRLIDRCVQTLPSSGVGDTGGRTDWAMAGLNSPVGTLVDTLMFDPNIPDISDGFGLPSSWRARVERLLALPYPQRGHALAQLGARLVFLVAQDEAWTRDNVLTFFSDETGRAPLASSLMYRECSPILFRSIREEILKEARRPKTERTIDDRTLSQEILRAWITNLDGVDATLLSDKELRDILTTTDDDIRVAFLSYLEHIVRNEKTFSRKHVTSLFLHVWPRLQAVRTPSATVAILEIILASGPDLLEVAAEAERHLARLPGRPHGMVGLHTEIDTLRQHAAVVRKLFLKVLPLDPAEWPYWGREVIEELDDAHRKTA